MSRSISTQGYFICKIEPHSKTNVRTKCICLLNYRSTYKIMRGLYGQDGIGARAEENLQMDSKNWWIA